MNQQTKYYIAAAVIVAIIALAFYFYKNKVEYEDATAEFVKGPNYGYMLEFSKNASAKVFASFSSDGMFMEINGRDANQQPVPVKVFKSKNYKDRIQIRLASNETTQVTINATNQIKPKRFIQF